MYVDWMDRRGLAVRQPLGAVLLEERLCAQEGLGGRPHVRRSREHMDGLELAERQDEFDEGLRDLLETSRPSLQVMWPSDPGGGLAFPFSRPNMGASDFHTCLAWAIQVALSDIAVGVDTPIAEERPVGADDVQPRQIAGDDH